ncbi:Uncharacterized protein OS=Rivularia sp. PCC 7116 GN=Riv7116_2885 PE=4 SV=1: DUF4288 [Gemmata massiliana]|uniref:DUF4288 domain-containing protein n=1 Tax=Gemmata massiliana TaxID=1210884 RepID=A0A6P2CY49_9BACT|nr:DUF4288 domain-containing protein [Gemmata massiliana]VTR93035.1 Uncharacterized protein OS=Rivularia sp. PCC 7116 GN=Riv7116_2885 PE=4 SV=1: DUF4288 [Gemmata massiliana]
MGFIPKDACWYLADVVMEHRIEGDERNIVHVNTHLIEAGSPDEAYEKAQALGRDGESDYENTDGQRVRVLFRGLRELNVIHEPLEDGAELMYTEDVGVPEEKLQTWNRSREKLAVFAPIRGLRNGPNYLPGVFKPLVDGASENESPDDR